MTTNDQFQAALDRAKANRIITSHEVVLDLYGEPFSFQFLAKTPMSGLELIGQVQDLAGTEDIEGMMKLVVEFLDAMSVGDTAERIAVLLREGVLGMEDLVALQIGITERVSGRPTGSSAESEDGSSSIGSDSTDGQLAATST